MVLVNVANRVDSWRLSIGISAFDLREQDSYELINGP